MDEYRHQQPHRRQKRRKHNKGKAIVILFLCIVGFITAGKLKSVYANSDVSAFLNVDNPISMLADGNSAQAAPTGDNSTQDASISTDITATNACVISADTDMILFQKNSSEQIAPASTTKMLTALTVLDYCSPSDALTVGLELDLVALDASRAWLNDGDELTAQQLLVAMLLPSGNDAAYTLAVNTGKKIAGDDNLTIQQYVEIFIDAMNRKAEDIGALDSNFTTPDGYDADGQYTTAYDLAQIAKACLNNSCLAEIMGSFRISDTWLNGREVTYYNSNELLDPGSAYYDPDVIGLKTGNSSQAGACLVSAAKINGETYICVAMGSTDEGRFQDSINIYNELKTLEGTD